jgi:malate dehydrogenase (oxaloacetate-decarboxylating)(NADP+)
VPLSNLAPRGVGFVHHSIAILYHQVPNLSVTIRNFFIAVEQVVFQFTAFDYINGMRLLQRHRADAVIFNDDLQGLATTALAALLESVGKGNLGKKKYLFVGAGEAGTTFADLLAYAISRYECISLPEVRVHAAARRPWLPVDEGLVRGLLH